MTIRSGSLTKGICLAWLLAGPIFITMLGVYEAALRFPQAIDIVAREAIVILPMFLILAAIFGAIISMPANLIGGFAMGALSERYHWLRPYMIWTMTGTLMGVLIAIIFADNSPQMAFALIATSTVCASICRHWVRWDDDQVDGQDMVDRWPKLPE